VKEEKKINRTTEDICRDASAEISRLGGRQKDAAISYIKKLEEKKLTDLKRSLAN